MLEKSSRRSAVLTRPVHVKANCWKHRASRSSPPARNSFCSGSSAMRRCWGPASTKEWRKWCGWGWSRRSSGFTKKCFFLKRKTRFRSDKIFFYVKNFLTKNLFILHKKNVLNRNTIFQCIGIKQLKPFFEALFENGETNSGDYMKTLSFVGICEKKGIDRNALKNVEKIEKNAKNSQKTKEKRKTDGNELFKILFEAIERIKLNTFQYSKKQKKWIESRFFGVENVFVVGLDATGFLC